MDNLKRIWTIGSYSLIGLGLLILALNLFLKGTLNLGLPLVILMLAGAIFLLALTYTRRWQWAVFLFFPGAILLALGWILLLNMLTNDWNSWAYAWLLLVAGLGLGLVLAGWYGRWRQETMLVGTGLILLGLVLFALFGVLVGGLVIKIMAPLLLLLGGLSLRWLRPERILPERILRRFSPSAAETLEPAARIQAASPALPNLPDPLAAAGHAGLAEPLSSQNPLSSPVSGVLLEPLSARELEVLGLIERGLANAQIADALVLAPSTVKTHINNIYAKLEVQTRVQALKRARELGLL
jgi:DNA-binding CsgD family transcriptional regulator